MRTSFTAFFELVKAILAQREQVVIINSRIGITDTLQHRLADAGGSS